MSSYGSLHTFKQSKKPKEAGAATHCLSCAYEPECVWSAKKIYLDQFDKADPHVGEHSRSLLMPIAQWMTKAVIDAEVLDIETVAEALKTSRYGQCVYESKNDVVDHQTVIVEYQGGTTASLTMSACE